MLTNALVVASCEVVSRYGELQASEAQNFAIEALKGGPIGIRVRALVALVNNAEQAIEMLPQLRSHIVEGGSHAEQALAQAEKALASVSTCGVAATLALVFYCDSSCGRALLQSKESLPIDAKLLEQILCQCEAQLRSCQPLLLERIYDKLVRSALQWVVSLCAETSLAPKHKGESAPQSSKEMLPLLSAFGERLGLAGQELAHDGIYLNPLRLLLELLECDTSEFIALFATMRAKYREISLIVGEAVLSRRDEELGKLEQKQMLAEVQDLTQGMEVRELPSRAKGLAWPPDELLPLLPPWLPFCRVLVALKPSLSKMRTVGTLARLGGSKKHVVA